MKKIKPIYIYVLALGTAFSFLGLNLVSWERDELLVRGFSQWLDYPVHLAFSRAMESIQISQIFQTHPYFPWTPFNYYFVPDYLVTLLLKMGLRFDLALLFPTVLAFILYVHQKALFLSRKNLPFSVTVFSDLLFLLWGGLGFVLFLLYPNEFGITNNYELTNFYFSEPFSFICYYANPLNGQFFASKNVVFGLALFFLSLNLLESRKFGLLLGVLVLFPFFHAHSFLFFIIWWGLSLVWECRKKDIKGLLWFLASAFLCLVILKMTILRYSGQGFLELIWGWRSSPFSLETYNVLILGTGFFWPLVIWAFYKLRGESFVRFLAAFVCLALLMTHFIKWQPNIWDNIKIYNFAHLVAAMILALFISRFKKKFVAWGLVGLLCLNGIWETSLIHFSYRHQYPLVNRSDLELSEKFSKAYSGGKVLYENLHNHWYPILNGTNIAVGFLYNLWTWGVPYQSYLTQLAPLLNGSGSSADHLKLGIRYVIASKKERLFPPADQDINPPYFMMGFDLKTRNLKELYPEWYYPRKSKNALPYFYVNSTIFPRVNIAYYKAHYPVILEDKNWLIFDVGQSLDKVVIQ